MAAQIIAFPSAEAKELARPDSFWDWRFLHHARWAEEEPREWERVKARYQEEPTMLAAFAMIERRHGYKSPGG